jgi:hypothetical protein
MSCRCGERRNAKHCRGSAEPGELKKLTPFHSVSPNFRVLHGERDRKPSIDAQEN